MKKLIGIGVLVWLVVGLGITACANDASFGGRGNTVYPLQNNQIKMVSEKVYVTEVEVKDVGWQVECSFVFHNTGKETIVQMGFPDARGSGGVWTIRNFKTYVNGKPVNVTAKEGEINKELPDLKYEKVFVWDVSFKANETKQLKNTYSFGKSFSSEDVHWIDYVLKTGALWKGNIGKADITIEFIPLPGVNLADFVYGITPRSYSIKENKIFWHFSDFKPDTDIHISYSAFPAGLKQEEEAIKRAPLSPEMAKRQFELGKKYRGQKQKEILSGLIEKYPKETDICREAKDIIDALKEKEEIASFIDKFMQARILQDDEIVLSCLAKRFSQGNLGNADKSAIAYLLGPSAIKPSRYEVNPVIGSGKKGGEAAQYKVVELTVYNKSGSEETKKIEQLWLLKVGDEWLIDNN